MGIKGLKLDRKGLQMAAYSNCMIFVAFTLSLQEFQLLLQLVKEMRWDC